MFMDHDGLLLSMISIAWKAAAALAGRVAMGLLARKRV